MTLSICSSFQNVIVVVISVVTIVFVVVISVTRVIVTMLLHASSPFERRQKCSFVVFVVVVFVTFTLVLASVYGVRETMRRFEMATT